MVCLMGELVRGKVHSPTRLMREVEGGERDEGLKERWRSGERERERERQLSIFFVYLHIDKAPPSTRCNKLYFITNCNIHHICTYTYT